LTRDGVGAICGTLVDVSGLVIYFSVAYLVLRGTLL
jgi:Mg/Co/Ni transporter MgtE